MIVKALLVTIALGGCTELIQNHPVATTVVIGSVQVGAGVGIAYDNHPIAGGFAIGIGVATLIVAIPLSVIIDNFNEAHRH